MILLNNFCLRQILFIHRFSFVQCKDKITSPSEKTPRRMSVFKNNKNPTFPWANPISIK